MGGAGGRKAKLSSPLVKIENGGAQYIAEYIDAARDEHKEKKETYKAGKIARNKAKPEDEERCPHCLDSK